MVRMFLIGVLLGTVAACGGGEKEAAEPVVDDEPVAQEPAEEEVLIPQEKLDEVQAFFDRKSRTVSRCWGDAIDAGEVEANAQGRVVVWLTIRPDGSPTDIRLEEVQPRSETLEACILEKVERWQLPTLPREMEYAYQFAFEQL